MTPRNLMFMFEAYFHCKNETSNITADHLLNIYHQIQELENDIKFMSLIKKFVDYDIDAYWKWIALQNYLKDLWEMKFQMIRLGKQSNPYRAYKEVIKKAMAEENVDVGYVGYLIHQIKNLQEGR